MGTAVTPSAGPPHPATRVARGASDWQARAAARNRREFGLGPLTLVAFKWPLLLGPMLGKEVGTPGTPCERMHSE